MSQNPFSFDCFAEALGMVREQLDAKNFYAINPAFDRKN